jgi:hypothetical protein
MRLARITASKAWTTLVDHYEDDGIYRLAELLQDMEKA